MRLSIRSLFILTLVLAVSIVAWMHFRNSNQSSWSTAIHQGSAFDNPGYILFLAKIENCLAEEGFVQCRKPDALFEIQDLNEGKWFRSTKHEGLFVFTYADLRFYVAEVKATVRGSKKRELKLRLYTHGLIEKFRALWKKHKQPLPRYSEQ